MYLLMARVVFLLYNTLHYKQVTLLDCEILTDRITIKIFSVASNMKPVSLLSEEKKKSLEIRLLSDVASCRGQFSLSIFWLYFLSFCCRFTLRCNSSGE